MKEPKPKTIKRKGDFRITHSVNPLFREDWYEPHDKYYLEYRTLNSAFRPDWMPKYTWHCLKIFYDNREKCENLFNLLTE